MSEVSEPEVTDAYDTSPYLVTIVVLLSCLAFGCMVGFAIGWHLRAAWG